MGPSSRPLGLNEGISQGLSALHDFVREIVEGCRALFGCGAGLTRRSETPQPRPESLE